MGSADQTSRSSSSIRPDARARSVIRSSHGPHNHQMPKRTGHINALEKGGWILLVGDDKEALQDRKVLKRMVMVAIWCVQEDPSLRPSMKRVVRMMAGVVEVSAPMDPCF
ncbi:G-type lectin S-receptor-like serine/threonine-protein kinase LECRK3 [Cinnamomum micranthum f. kanehirae]|uniref:G-type lectin S-receptor-like serine/threonine-protein kinase LECRK3 n=1 Tax=Cinnamomum micranthum f. kanehirae TaxID=337451 RepID=A0A3S3MFC2_9MAGN|nr:G-type lectin S-receptor-like serine/threonine-protein kinase LECRK3 [Cinnamomum micranthum f. kanehirae]